MHRALIILAVAAFVILSVMTVVSQMNPSAPSVTEEPMVDEWTESIAGVGEQDVEMSEDAARLFGETMDEAATQAQESAEPLQSTAETLTSTDQEAPAAGQ